MDKTELESKLEELVVAVESRSEENTKAEQAIIYNLKTAIKYVDKLED